MTEQDFKLCMEMLKVQHERDNLHNDISQVVKLCHKKEREEVEFHLRHNKDLDYDFKWDQCLVSASDVLRILGYEHDFTAETMIEEAMKREEGKENE